MRRNPLREPSAPDYSRPQIDPLSRIFELLSEIREKLSGTRKEFLTVEEVAEVVGRSPYTVRRWVAEGLLDATRVMGTGPRGRLLIARSQVDRVLSAGQHDSAAEELGQADPPRRGGPGDLRGG